MKIFKKFISLEAAGGYCLFLAAAIAILWSNSPVQASYDALINANFIFKSKTLNSVVPISFVIDEGLMTLFFFLVGLEIKRELLIGELNSVKRAMLPAIAALGGMVIPAMIYVGLNWNNPVGLGGWAIPTATDIAFSLAVLSLLKSRIPLSLKIFLTALAIFDDLGAILIIAIFYTQKISWLGLGLAFLVEMILVLLNIFQIALPILYFLLGGLIWWLLLISGIHPTLAGVLVALTVPLKIQKAPRARPLNDLQRALHPWVIFLLLPLFAFINSGISLNSLFGTLFTNVSLGIFFGLFLGKQLGVMSFCWVAVQSKLAELPAGMNWKNLYGISLLCGIGFTMSFFIGFLSFESGSFDYQACLRSGILLGSLLSGICGYVWLVFISKKNVGIGGSQGKFDRLRKPKQSFIEGLTL